MFRGLVESPLPILLYLVLVVGAIVLVVWALVMAIRVAYRWLRLHPLPPRGEPTDRPGA